MKRVFYFIFICINKIVFINGQYPNSPCPHMFHYEDDGIDTTGLLQILARTTMLRIEMKLSIGTNINSNFNGKLQLLENSWDAACAAMQQDGLHFRVYFPSQNPLPYVEEIKLNGKIICMGPNAPGSFVTTINLRYNLNLNCPNMYFPLTSPPRIPPTPKVPMVIKVDKKPIINNNVNINKESVMRLQEKPISIFRTIFNNNNICGTVDAGVIPLIVKGRKTTGSYPWLAQLYFRDLFVCGGNLVSNKHILTAAHCITENASENPKDYEIVLGVYLLEDSLGKQTVFLTPTRIHVHPSYQSASLSLATCDIAVIVIKPITFRKNIRPICVFESFPDISSVIGQYGRIAGWGTDETGRNVTRELRDTKVKIVSREMCLDSNSQFQDLLTNRNFCAGGINGAGPCTGDSGGGLFLNFTHQNIRRWYLRGIISLSLRDTFSDIQCDVTNYAVYTDIGKYVPWLKEFVN